MAGKRRIRILQVSSARVFGGNEEHIRTLVKYLDRDRFDVFAAAPQECEFAPVIEVPETGEARRLRAMSGLTMGYDSNPGRADDAARDSDGTATVAGGMALVGGNSRFRYSAATEARARRFFDRDGFDFDELAARGTAVFATQRARLGLRASHALRTDPVDVDELFFSLR